MRHKTTSWIRDNNGFPAFKLTTSHFFLKKNIRQILQDHPRFGGGIIISIICFLFLGIGFFWNFFPVDPGSTQKQIFDIPLGTSLRQVGQQLHSRGIIRSSLAFEVYVRLNPGKRMTKAGRYQLSPGMNLFQIIKELRRGIPSQIRVTVPEGLTDQEIATLFAEKGLADRDRFLNVLKDYQLIGNLLGDPQFKTKPEGYLFPDTYDFSLDVTEEEIVTKLIKRFLEVFDSQIGAATPIRRREILIIASIVEKEAKRAEERPLIAGVFYNRLRRGYPLQSCATVQFALGKHKERLYYKDLEVNSPYNTYRYSGLPPGPISNPGIASLKAAAAPAKVDYLYFVAKPDGSHIFSSTYQQHLLAQKMVERNQKSVGVVR